MPVDRIYRGDGDVPYQVTCAVCHTPGPTFDSKELAEQSARDLGFWRDGSGYWFCRDCHGLNGRQSHVIEVG